MLLKEIDYQGN